MTVRYERPVSYSALFSRRLAWLGFVLFVLSWALHRFGPLDTPYFLAVMLVAAVLAVVAVYLSFIGLAMLWNKGARGGKASAQALLLVVPSLVSLGFGAYNYANHPPLYDISSDLADPPRWLVDIAADQNWLGERPAAGLASRQAQAAGYPGLLGRRYEGALDRVYTAARKVALDLAITVTDERGAPDGALEEITGQDEQKGVAEDAVADSLDNVPVPLPRPDIADGDVAMASDGDASLQGVHRTFVFGFRQDVVIRLREEAETTLVDARVATRYGQHDLGTGAALIEAYFRALDAELLGIAGD
jgi:hypothetical protein